MAKRVPKRTGVGLYRKFGGKRFELYQENPVHKTIANSVAQQVREYGGQARIVESGSKGYYVVYARGMKGI